MKPPNASVRDIRPDAPVAAARAQWHGADAVTLTCRWRSVALSRIFSTARTSLACNWPNKTARGTSTAPAPLQLFPSATSPTLVAVDDQVDAENGRDREIETVTIFGTRQGVNGIGGSAHVIDAKQIARLGVH